MWTRIMEELWEWRLQQVEENSLTRSSTSREQFLRTPPKEPRSLNGRHVLFPGHQEVMWNVVPTLDPEQTFVGFKHISDLSKGS